MKIYSLPEQNPEFEARWLQACEDAGIPLPPALNPCVPAILQQVWHWPLLKIIFVRDGRVVALFSVMKIKARWVSMPHFDQGGLWWDTRVPESETTGLQLWQGISHVISQLQQQAPASEYAVEIDFDAMICEATKNPVLPEVEPGLFIRCLQPLQPSQKSGKVLSLFNLDASRDVMAQLPGGPARKVRKAIKNGLQLKSGGAELLHDFYSVYRPNIRRLGSFGLPLQFFEELLKSYKYGMARVYVCYYQDRAVGASLLLTFNACAENLWFAGNRKENKLYTSYLLHYGMMRDAQAAGCRLYSMGRSTEGGGVHRYKSQYGSFSVPLYYNSNHPETGSLPAMGLLRGMVRLLPLFLATRMDKRVGRLFY